MPKKWIYFLLFLLLMLPASTIAEFQHQQWWEEEEELMQQEAALEEQEIFELVRSKLLERSTQLCINPDTVHYLKTSVFELDGMIEYNGADCYLVRQGGSTFALSEDGAHLYEWEPVSKTYVEI